MNALVVGLLLHQGIVMLDQNMERSRVYREAVDAAKAYRKPLLVVGGPMGSNPLRRIFPMKAHGCGDICMDIDPWACTGCPFIQADIRSIPYTNKYFGAAYSSHVLEHMPTLEDLELAWSELHRVSNSVHICVPGKDSIIAWLIPDHHLWVKRLDQDTLWAEERTTGRVMEVVASGAIGRSKEGRTWRQGRASTDGVAMVSAAVEQYGGSATGRL